MGTNGRTVVWLVLAGAMGWVGYGISFGAVASFIPASDPSTSADEIVRLYTDNLLRTQLGLSVGAASLTCVLMWGVAVFMVSRRIEKGFPAFSYLQLAAMTMSNGFTILCTIIWCIASFRAGEISPDITRTLHDFGWVMWELSWPPYFLWLVAIGLVILRDRSPRPILPRWAGYVTIGEAVVNFLDMFPHMFTTGPLAYNGFYAFWITVFVFWAWAVAMTILVIRAARRPEIEEESVLPVSNRGIGSLVGV